MAKYVCNIFWRRRVWSAFDQLRFFDEHLKRVFVCAMVLLVLFPLSLQAADQSMLFVIGDRQHIEDNDPKLGGAYPEPSCTKRSSSSWPRGLWFWDNNLKSFEHLLGGCRSCSVLQGRPVCSDKDVQRGDYSRQFVAYDRSSIAISPDGRWAAVSGLVLDLPELGFPEAAKRDSFDVSRIDPVIYADHYRVLLVDLQAWQAGEDGAVYTLLDSRRRAKYGPHTVEIDPVLVATWPFLAARELSVNPRSTQGADYESFEWGKDARLHLEFDPRGQRLYVRVLTYAIHETTWIERYPTVFGMMGDYETDRLSYPGAHLSFVVDFEEPDFPTLFRTVIPNQSYVAASTIASSDEHKSFASFTLSPQSESGQFLARGRMVPTNIVPKWRRIFSNDEMVYELWLESHEDSDKWFDNLVGTKPNRLFANYYAIEGEFDPFIRWFGDSLYVRTGLTDGSIFSMADILANTPSSELDDRPIAVEPEREVAKVWNFNFHGLPMAEVWYQRGWDRPQPHNQVVMHGDHLILSDHRVLEGIKHWGPRADVDLPMVYNWRDQTVNYLIYPYFFGRRGKERVDTFALAQQAEAARRLPPHDLHPHYMVMFYEASPEEMRFSPDGQYVYFLESRPTMEFPWHRDDEPILKSYRQSMPRKEPFWKMRWPALARVKVGGASESDIERLGYKAGKPGWYNGLLFDDYAPSVPVVPAQGVSAYAFAPNQAVVSDMPGIVKRLGRPTTNHSTSQK